MEKDKIVIEEHHLPEARPVNFSPIKSKSNLTLIKISILVGVLVVFGMIFYNRFML